MGNIKVQDGQTIFDIVLRYYGSLESIISFLQLNNLSATQKLTAGQALEVGEPSNLAVVKIFEAKNYDINTGSLEEIKKEFNNDFNNDFA